MEHRPPLLFWRHFLFCFMPHHLISEGKDTFTWCLLSTAFMWRSYSTALPPFWDILQTKQLIQWFNRLILSVVSKETGRVWVSWRWFFSSNPPGAELQGFKPRAGVKLFNRLNKEIICRLQLKRKGALLTRHITSYLHQSLSYLTTYIWLHLYDIISVISLK